MLAAGGGLAGGLGGCGAVLTTSQAKVVQQFSQANGSYSKLPASVLRSYGEVHFATEVLGASVTDGRDAALALKGVHHALEFQQSIKTDTAKLAAALQIFDSYAGLLGKLAADNPAGDLDAAATDLGGALAQSISVYNGLPPGKAGPLPSIGADVGAAARALGGLFVRNRQLVYLRQYVTAADPVIQRLTADVKELVGTLVGPQGHLAADKDALDATFTTYFIRHATVLGASDVRLFANTLRKNTLAAELAQEVLDASTKLAAAHKALGPALDPKPSLGAAWAEVKTLIAQVQAAAQVETTLEAAAP
jgi:hypothetical protein